MIYSTGFISALGPFFVVVLKLFSSWVPIMKLLSYFPYTGVPLVVVGISAGIFHDAYGAGSM